MDEKYWTAIVMLLFAVVFIVGGVWHTRKLNGKK